MTINSKELVGVNVETRSGEHVGKVASLDIVIQTGHLAAIRVKLPGIISGLLSDEISVVWIDIIEITPKLVIISDGAVPVRVKAHLLAKTEPASPSSNMMMNKG